MAADGWNPPEWENSSFRRPKKSSDTPKELVVNTLSVSFEEDIVKLQPSVVIEQMTERFNYKGELLFRLFPTDAEYLTTVGNITGGEMISQTINESLKFSNSTSAKLKYPNATNLEINVNTVMLHQVIDDFGELSIKRFNQDLWFDDQSNEIKGELPFYGGCTVRYNVLYTVLYYTPKTIAIPHAGGGIAALTVYLGSIYAWKGLTVTVHDITLQTDKDSKEYEELYRVTSKIVLDPEGTWEYPPNWEETDNSNKDIPQGSNQRKKHPMGKFPGTSHEIDPDVSLTDERLHKSGKYNFMGQITHETVKANTKGNYYAPYTFSDNYTPKYTLTWKKPTWKPKMSYEDELFFEAFWSIDHKGVYDDLLKDFPGLIDEGIK